MRFILNIFLFFLFTTTLFATKASPLPTLVKLPDGSQIRVLVRGDEYFRYTTTIDGYIIAQAKDGFYYYADYGSGKLNISPTKASSHSMMFSGSRTKSIPESIRNNIRSRNLDAKNIRRLKSENRDIKTLVLLVEFSDVKFTFPKSHFENLVNQPGHSFDGATGSVKDYFMDNLSDYYSFDFTVSDVITLPNNSKYYGANSDTRYDVKVGEMIIDACNAANAAVDFSQYDVDKDGVVDGLFIIFAGYNEAEGGGDNAVWPHSWNIASSGLLLDGVTMGAYGCASELRAGHGQQAAGIGTFCHEFGHLLGLVDLYDVDEEYNGLSNALWGSLSLMDTGNYNNLGKTPPYLCAIDRELLGVLTMDVLEVNKSYSLLPIGEAKRAGRVLAETNNEYFLFENRTQKGWDAYIGGSGLVVYHIDKSERFAGGIQSFRRWANNRINAESSHECANLVEANIDAKAVEDVFFPGKNNITEYSLMTNPPFVDWDGKGLGVRLENISYELETVFFNVRLDTSERLYSVVSAAVAPYQKQALLEWDADTDAHVKWGLLFGETSKFEGENVLYTTLEKKYEFEDLTPETEYTCKLFNIGLTGKGDTLNVSFRTIGLSSAYPYISGIKSEYKYGDVIDLKVFNLSEEVGKMSWYIDSVPAKEGYNILTHEGEVEIKVIIEYAKDKSEEIIKRIINIGLNE